MSAARELLVSSRKAQKLPATLEDDRACEQIAMLLNEEGGPRRSRQPDVLTVTTPRPTRLERGGYAE